MSSKAGFLTLAGSSSDAFQFPAFGDLEIKLVERALRKGWAILAANPQDHDVDLANDGEVKISERLVRVVELVRSTNLVRDFRKHFETPHTDGSLRNYCGSTLTKRPDMSFKLVVNRFPGMNGFYRRLYVEAKVIGGGNQTVGAYFIDGVTRYLIGDYAWAVPQGIMLAYVRPGQKTIPQALNNYLSTPERKRQYQVKEMPKLCEYTDLKPPAYDTVHSRKWTFPDGTKPNNIKLIHIWLGT